MSLLGVMKKKSLTSEQLKAARAMLRWGQRDLANASEVSLPTIKRLEAVPGPIGANAPTLAALRRALEAAGVEFLNGTGVRLVTPGQDQG